MALVLTPLVFYDLFLLAASWEWHNDTIPGTSITVDKVARMLVGLGIMTPKQKKALSRDRRVQTLFMCHLTQQNSDAAFKVSPTQIKGSTLDAILSTTTDLVVRRDFAQETLNRERLLRDMRIHLTRTGVDHAAALEDQYASHLTREQYLAEVVRQEATAPRTRGGRAAMMQQYHARVDRETGDKDDRPRRR